jgi:type IV secretory pathway TraG/TraD family ATPase VirD4
MTTARDGANYGFGVFAAAIVVYALGIAGGLVSGVFFGHQGWPTHHIPGVIAILRYSGDPSLAWGVPVGRPVLYWTSTAAVFAVAISSALYLMRLFSLKRRKSDGDPTHIAGLADRREVREAAGEKQLLAHGATIRPSVKRPALRDLGFDLGVSCQEDCYSSYEMSIGIVGPPRSGKGYNLVIPMILDAPGAVVTTSTKTDNLSTTMIARSKLGSVTIFDPEGLAMGVTGTLRWSPLRGCEDPTTAMRRASTLCAGVGDGVKDAGLWVKETETVVQCLLHAGAIESRTASDLHRWSLSAPNSREAVKILAENPSATQRWSEALDGVISSDERHRDILWSFVRSVFASLAAPRVLDQLIPEPGSTFEPLEFLKSRGTLYLLGTASGKLFTENLVSAFIEDIIDAAYFEAARSVGGKLDPPCSLILDEAANYPLKSLGGLMSTGGGNGITTVAVLQSLAQLRAQFGYEMATAIWDSANAKIILGGSSSVSDLRDVSQLIGDRDVTESSTTNHDSGGRSVSESMRQRPVLDPAMIHSISMGHALLLLRNAKPIMLTLKPWTKRQRKEARELRANKKVVEKMLREGARDWVKRREGRTDGSTGRTKNNE